MRCDIKNCWRDEKGELQIGDLCEEPAAYQYRFGSLTNTAYICERHAPPWLQTRRNLLGMLEEVPSAGDSK